MHRRGIAAGVTSLVLMGTLSGCWTGYQAQTTVQEQGGSVTNADVGTVQARGMVWVRDPENPGTAYFSGTMLVQPAAPADALISISTETGGDAGLTVSPLEIAPRLPASIGFTGEAFASVDGVPDSLSPFLLTTLEFRDAGTVTTSVLVVNGVGPYEQVVTRSQEALGTGGDEENAATTETESAATAE